MVDQLTELIQAKTEMLDAKIEAIRIRLADLMNFFEKAVANTTENFRRSDGTTENRLSAYTDLLRGEIEALRILKDHDLTALYQRFEDSREAITNARAAGEHAVTIALMNQKEIITRVESQFGSKLSGLEQRVDDLKEVVAKIAGTRLGTAQMIGWLIGAAGLIITLAGAFIGVMRFAAPR